MQSKGNRPDTAVLICGYSSNLNLVLPAVGDYFTFGDTGSKRQVVEESLNITTKTFLFT